MPITTTFNYTADLSRGAASVLLRQPLFTLDANAHTFAVDVVRSGEAANLTGTRCEGWFIRADGATVAIDGEIVENTAIVTLLPACYAVAGRFTLAVKLVQGSVIHTILRAEGSIDISRTDVTPEEDTGGDSGSTDQEGAVPAYVAAEAERVADAVSAVRTAKSLVLLCASDIHTLMTNAQSVETTLHLAQGMNEISKRVAVDGIAILGDSATGGPDSTVEDCKNEIDYLRDNLGSTQGVPQIWMAGNHDHNSQNSAAGYLTADELYTHIGANTTDKAVTDYDNLHRMYGYVDYSRQRIRAIYLNTSDITDSYASDYGMTTVQAQWLADTLAAVPSGWGAVVMSHHPLNGYISAYLGTLTLLDAFKGKQSGTVGVGGGTVTYNFTAAAGELICHLHGHIHNYQAAVYGANGVLSVTIPNGCFWRNNEYGTGGNADWGDTDADGNQRVFAKTAGTAEDTAFSAVVIDRKNGLLYALRYGAGVDRIWDYVNGVEVDSETPETPDEPDVPEEPDTPDTAYTNLVPTATDETGAVLNGVGYIAGKRWGSSSAGFSTYKDAENGESQVLFGMIPFRMGQTLRVKNGRFTSAYSSTNAFKTFAEDRSNLATGYVAFSTAASQYGTDFVIGDDEESLTFTPNAAYSPHITENMAYIAMTIMVKDSADNVIITVDEEITD